jgi:hypothetical protein
MTDRTSKQGWSRIPWWVVALASAALLGTFIWVHYSAGYYFWGRGGFATGNDDAYISFRFARNLVEHGVLTFNPGDDPPIEGYSNPLYVALAVLLYVLVGSERMYPASAVVGALAVLGALVMLVRWAWQHHGPAAAVFVGVTLALCPPWWIHATSGLETALVTFGQVLLWLQTVQATRSSDKAGVVPLCVTTVALVLLRTDGFVFPAIAAAWLVLKGRKKKGTLILLTAAAAFAATVVARHAYYGELMPNPYYAKINGTIGARLLFGGRMLGSIAYKNGLWVGMLAGAVVAWGWLREVLFDGIAAVRKVPFELWTFLALCSYYLIIGGDIYRDRFLLILFPMGGLLLWRCVAAGSAQRLIAAAVLLIAAQLVALKVDARLSYHRPKYDRFETVGRFLGDHFPGATVATGAAGKIPYFSDLHTIDMLGLNDRHIARTEPRSSIPGHGRFDVEYVLARKPDIIASHAYGDGDLTYGLNRATYRAHGYRLVYLVLEVGTDRPPLVDVSGRPGAEVTQLIAEGYNYGILLRPGDIARPIGH